MGTNFYLHEGVCEKCGHGRGEPLHIGKSSVGWTFALHVIPEKGLLDLPDWIKRWSAPDVQIQDEYGDFYGAKYMERIITERRGEAGMKPLEWYRDNWAEPGPEGLTRRKVRRGWCSGHGAGTWDLCPGDFS